MDSLFGIPLPIENLVLLFGVSMLVILVTPILFERIKLPGITGPIIAGVILGPSVLNVLQRGEALELLGRVGLLYIMFLAGLEIDVNQVSRHGRRSLVFGLITFSIPQIAGTVIFLGMGFGWAASILIASMFASHTLVAYPIISRLDIMKDDAVITTVGGTIVTDTIALLILVVVARAWQGELTALFWLYLAISMTIFVLAILFLLPRLTRWFFKHVRDGGKSEFVFVVTVVFLCAFLADAIGTEAILGAFLAGLTLNPLIPSRSSLMSRVQFFGDAFIIPFFLLFIGLLVDVSVLASSATVWLVMITMLTTNVVTKLIASTITSRIYNYSKAQNMVIFGLSTCEAAATLAATLVGLELGIIGNDVLNGVILMIFVTCVMGPWFVERFGREIVRARQNQPADIREAPQRILVPLANPATAETLMDVAFMLRDKHSQEAVFPLAVVPGPVSPSRHTESEVAEAEKLLAHAVVHATKTEVHNIPLTRVASNPAVGIIRAATERRISDIVIGWNGVKSAGERIFGSIIDQTLDDTAQQVLVCKIEHPLSTFKRLLVILPPLIDYSPGFSEALRTLKNLGLQLGTSLIAICEAAEVERLQECFRAIEGDIHADFVTTSGWRQIMDTVMATYKANDLVLLLSARRGTIAYRDSLEHFPRTLANTVQDFLVLYPSERSLQRQLTHQGLPDILTEERIVLGMTTVSYEKAVETLLNSTIDKSDKRHWSVLRALVYDEVGYATEILPGVLLPHAQVRELKEPMMFLGLHSEGIKHVRANGTVHVIALLLTPAERPLQDHLLHLAETAQLFRDEKELQALFQSTTVDDIRRWFDRQRLSSKHNFFSASE
jgi:Kef-type K+ transport system membrane component KefB/mannitol/fructose-specific phosphotransferase system IIA component (Ntr-type)